MYRGISRLTSAPPVLSREDLLPRDHDETAVMDVCTDGHRVLWKIPGKIDRVKIKRFAVMDLVGWNRPASKRQRQLMGKYLGWERYGSNWRSLSHSRIGITERGFGPSIVDGVPVTKPTDF